MKKAIIIGATSGIGQEVAKCLLLDGWQIGVAGRRQSALENLQRAAPDQIQIQTLDVTQEDAGEKLNMLIDKVGGMDLFLLSSGIGFQNTNLNMEVELNTAYTNVEGPLSSISGKAEAATWQSSVPSRERKDLEWLLPTLPPNASRTLT